MKDDDQEEEGNSWEGKTCLDIGSGTGRLVIGCAALHPGMGGILQGAGDDFVIIALSSRRTA